jgi:DNA-binding FadR family transcriptional regulator
VPTDSPPSGRQCASDHTKVIWDALAHSLSTLQEHFRGDRKSCLPRAPTQRITVGARRAGQIARNIVAQLAQTPLAPGVVRFGSERDLSHRFSISKSIARQVVRLLEDLNVARSERGSGHGIFVNPPTVHRPAETIGLYLLTHASTPESSWEVAQMLRVECAQLAASHPSNVREPMCGEVSTVLQQLSDGNRPYDLEALFLIDRAVESTSGNPLLTLILEGLKAYSALAQPLRDRRLARFVSAHGARYLELTREALAAIKQGDPQAAGQAQRHVNRFFTDHVRRATTAESREPV